MHFYAYGYHLAKIVYFFDKYQKKQRKLNHKREKYKNIGRRIKIFAQKL